MKYHLSKDKGKVIDVLLTECDWDYVKKLYENDFERMQVEIDKLHSDNKQLHSDNEQLSFDIEQLHSNNEQLHSDNEQLLFTLLETYKSTGCSKECALAQIKKKLPNIPSELVEAVMEQVFS